VVVLDDANNGFRGQDTSWLDSIIAEKPIVILKMFRKLADGYLWDHLQKNCHDRLIVVINADDLRTEGMKISKRLSWDRTAMDFRHYITENKAFAKLTDCPNLIVRFGLDGAILYRKSGGETTARLFFDPKSLEDDFSDRYNGSMIGHASVFIAAVCAEIAPNNLNALNMGIRKGLEASRRLLQFGFGNETDNPVFQFKVLFESKEDKLSKKDKPEFVDIPLPQTGNRHPLTKKDHEDWSILNTLHEDNLEYIAYEIVCNGDASSLQKVPIAEYGKFKTVDRSEIESFQSIKNLMREYLRKTEENRPLSIAVFGPPGSGKSFGVTELAESLGDERIERKTFNLAQFRSMDDLVSTFHKIRDLAITGKVPLVFFDEFDAYFENTKLGWLKYFLAPMQDGEFKEGEETHPIGRAIFVFAGGTSFSFESFQGESIKSRAEREKFKQEFAVAKGTDFVSRLRGFVNILGINPKSEDGGRNDYIIRRAVLLRSLLEKKAGHLIENRTRRSPVDQSVFFALINTHKYKHGSRSMEAIIDMSMLQERKVFEPAALPSIKQLEMHVNADDFMNLLMANINWDWESNIIELAKQIHKHHIDKHSKTQEKTEDDRLKDWDDLEEYLKESNLRQAEHIPFKLRTIGYDIYPATTEEEPFQLDDSQKNKLAIIEHDRWMNERIQQGWQYGDEEDNENMTNPLLKHWDELIGDEKNGNINDIHRFLEIMEEHDLEVYYLLHRDQKR
jgi:hypothetical protein